MMHVNTVADLAIFGGAPKFAEKLHVGRPNIGDRERLLGRINDILDRRWLTNSGKYVCEFEHRVADLAGVEHCVAMCNGTVALEIAVRALRLKGEVIIPSFTFVATAHALRWQEITPVFCDVDPQTHNIDVTKIEPMITPRTSAIIGVHSWGRPCDIERLEQIANQHGLKLLFDAAHAFACSHRGRMIGSFGNAEVYSFHATKFVNTFEGGAVATNDSDLASQIRLMRNFGFVGYDRVACLGINGKMSEVSAAMGLTGLDSLDEFIAVNRRNYERYRQELEGVRGIELVTYDDVGRQNYQYVVLEVDASRLGVSRDQLVRILEAENIMARRYFYPGCHRMEPYRSRLPQRDLHLPHTEALTQRVVSLPTGTSIDPEAVAAICQIIRFVGTHRDEIQLAMTPGNDT
ncbi:MAG: aminotransferase class I/II-fold pyridoxal phosphate-dependent enzyme [Planctomycetota bacterium]